MNHRKRRELIDALIEGEITEAEFLQLEAELTVDKALREEYLERVTLSMLLRKEATEADANNSLPTKGVRLPDASGSRLRWMAGIGTVVAIGLIAMQWWPRSEVGTFSNATAPSTVPPAIVEAEAAGYSVISGQDDVIWGDLVSRATGSLLPTGDMKLTAGVVQLELFSGVSVVVEGPADFAVTSPMHMSVRFGKVRAHVPEPAHGFRVSTRDGDVVDLGTDFAVDVASAGSEFHVLEGEIEIESNGTKRRLRTGEALSSSSSVLANLAADRQRFLGQREIGDRLREAMKSRRERWLEWANQLRSDPRLVALYQPGVNGNAEDWRTDRRIVNQAQSDFGASEGTAVAAVRTTDRWLNRDGALDFSPTGSRVRLTIPGEYQSLTLSCWVKINSLDRWYNSLFLTDGHDKNEPHWQIMDDGRLFFSVKKRDQWDATKGEKDKHIYFSPPFWNTSLSGQWLMITTVYDVKNRVVTHYVNGKAIGEEAIPPDYLVEGVQIGNASLCNWSSPERDEPRFAVRNLNGSLDEFAMFSDALTAAEIQEMFEHGSP